MPASELLALTDAFRAIRQDTAPHVLTDGHRQYHFGRFSILAHDRPHGVRGAE